MFEWGRRIYPESWAACIIVWLLDRLPERLHAEVLCSYWTPADLELARHEADELHRTINALEGRDDD